MAEAGGDQQAQIIQTFKHFVTVSSVGKTLTEEQKKEITDKGMNKMLKTCCNDAVAKVAEAQVFTAVNGKEKKMKLDKFLNEFLPALAITIIHNDLQKKTRGAPKPSKTDGPVVAKLNTIREQIAAKHGTTTQTAKVNDVTSRLTDTTKYTGAHKGRFDEGGQGKGIQGREDIADNSGYVKGYKNEGTY